MTETLLLNSGKKEETAQQSHREPTPMQKAAVEAWVQKGVTKKEAMREAGYSEAVLNKPSRVFNSPAVQEILEEAGIDLTATLKQLQRKVFSRRLEHMVFPTYDQEKAKQRLEKAEATAADATEEARGEQMTDADIRDMLDELGFKVRKIVHGDTVRHVYFWADNDKAQLDAIEKIINLHGVYAPKKTEVKGSVAHYSLSDLRRLRAKPGESPKNEAL